MSEFGGLRTAQDTVDVRCGKAKQVDEVGAIRHQTAGHYVSTERVHCWQTVPRRQCDDQVAVDHGCGIRRQDQTTVWQAPDRFDELLDFGRILDAARHKLYPERGCHLARMLQAQELTDEILEIADDTSGDWVEKIEADGRAVMVVDHENIAGARLRIKALERQAARMALKKYGNRR